MSLYKYIHSIIGLNLEVIKPDISLNQIYVFIYAQRLGFAQGANPRRINYHQPGYQLSSTIRVSTIINYQGISYHQLSGYQLSSTIRVSTIINYQGISTIINQGINYHQLSGYQLSSTIRVSTINLSSTIRVYQLSSTRVSTIINYQGINYHQLSTIRVSIIIKYNIIFIKLPPPLSWQPMLSRILTHNILFIKFSPPPLLATNAFKDLQIQHSFYQNFPPPPPSLGNQCFQGSSNTTFFLSKFPPPLWQPMHSMIFKYNIFLIKIPPPLLATNAFNDFGIQHFMTDTRSGVNSATTD